jgi:hypothetical protein
VKTPRSDSLAQQLKVKKEKNPHGDGCFVSCLFLESFSEREREKKKEEEEEEGG